MRPKWSLFGALALEHAAQEIDVFREDGIKFPQFINFFYRVHDRRMVAPTELTPDLGERARRELLGQIHGNLAGPGHGTSAPRRMHIGYSDVEVLSDPLLYFLDGNPPVVGAEQVVEHFLSGLERNITPDQLSMSDDPVQRTLEFANVSGDLMGQKVHNFLRHLGFHLFGL